MKDLGVQNLYYETYTMLMKEKSSKGTEKHTVFMDWNTQHSNGQFSPN